MSSLPAGGSGSCKPIGGGTTDGGLIVGAVEGGAGAGAGAGAVAVGVVVVVVVVVVDVAVVVVVVVEVVVVVSGGAVFSTATANHGVAPRKATTKGARIGPACVDRRVGILMGSAAFTHGKKMGGPASRRQ